MPHQHPSCSQCLLDTAVMSPGSPVAASGLRARGNQPSRHPELCCYCGAAHVDLFWATAHELHGQTFSCGAKREAKGGQRGKALLKKDSAGSRLEHRRSSPVRHDVGVGGRLWRGEKCGDQSRGLLGGDLCLLRREGSCAAAGQPALHLALPGLSELGHGEACVVSRRRSTSAAPLRLIPSGVVSLEPCRAEAPRRSRRPHPKYSPPWALVMVVVVQLRGSCARGLLITRTPLSHPLALLGRLPTRSASVALCSSTHSTSSS